MEINIDNIIDGIAIKLNASFGDTYTIYEDEIPTGFHKPSFGILHLSNNMSRLVGGRYFVNCLFNVMYFTDKARRDITAHQLKIEWALREITLPNGIIMLGTDFNSEIIDGVGHNMINFNFFILEEQIHDYMLSLEQYQKLRK